MAEVSVDLERRMEIVKVVVEVVAVKVRVVIVVTAELVKLRRMTLIADGATATATLLVASTLESAAATASREMLSASCRL